MPSSSRPLDRRRFLDNVACGAALLAGGNALAACATATASGVATTASPSAAASATTEADTDQWDMSWTRQLSRQHRIVFDSPEVSSGLIVYHALSYIEAFAEVDHVKERDMNVVMVIRHTAVPMILNDVMWNRLGTGEALKLKDAKSGEFVKRNTYWRGPQPPDPAAPPRQNTLEALVARGAIILTCNVALRAQAFQLSQKEKLSMDDAAKQIRANVIPGVRVMPNGIYAVAKAQELGCQYLRV